MSEFSQAKLSHNIKGLAIIICAAGNSSRLGQPKQLLKFNEEKLLQRQLNLMQQVLIQSGLTGQVVCVLGANSGKIIEQINFSQVNVLINDNWQQGLSSTIAFAIHKLLLHKTNESVFDGVMIVLADQWKLQLQDILSLIDSWKEQCQLNNNEQIICSEFLSEEHQLKLSPPVIFPCKYFSELALLSPSDKGAQWLLNKYRNRVSVVSILNAKFDIDTPEQLALFNQNQNQNQNQLGLDLLSDTLSN